MSVNSLLLPLNQSELFLAQSQGASCSCGGTKAWYWEDSPSQQQVAGEDSEQGLGAPSVEVQGGQGASSLSHQDQVGPAEAWLRPADGLELT